jgi:hypothetical protein
MTTTAIIHTTATSGSDTWRRILKVVRLHLVNKTTIFGIPLLVLTIIFGASLVIWWVIAVGAAQQGVVTPEDRNVYIGGASFYLVVYMLVVAVQSVNLTFPFAQGYSVTRRDFYLGSVLAFTGLSLVYSVLMAVLGWLEDATKGWGLRGQMFSIRFLGITNPIEIFAFYLLAFLFFFFVGTAVATLYLRWRMWGLLGFFAGFILLVVGLIAIFTLTESWPQVGHWFASNGALGVATWSLVPTAIAAGAGLFVLRGATPRG